MNWIKITPETDLPRVEVLACNLEKEDYLVGHVYQNFDGDYECSDENTILFNPTHYCIITKPDKK